MKKKFFTLFYIFFFLSANVSLYLPAFASTSFYSGSFPASSPQSAQGRIQDLLNRITLLEGKVNSAMAMEGIDVSLLGQIKDLLAQVKSFLEKIRQDAALRKILENNPPLWSLAEHLETLVSDTTSFVGASETFAGKMNSFSQGLEGFIQKFSADVQSLVQEIKVVINMTGDNIDITVIVEASSKAAQVFDEIKNKLGPLASSAQIMAQKGSRIVNQDLPAVLGDLSSLIQNLSRLRNFEAALNVPAFKGENLKKALDEKIAKIQQDLAPLGSPQALVVYGQTAFQLSRCSLAGNQCWREHSQEIRDYLDDTTRPFFENTVMPAVNQAKNDLLNVEPLINAGLQDIKEWVSAMSLSLKIGSLEISIKPTGGDKYSFKTTAVINDSDICQWIIQDLTSGDIIYQTDKCSFEWEYKMSAQRALINKALAASSVGAQFALIATDKEAPFSVSELRNLSGDAVSPPTDGSDGDKDSDGDGIKDADDACPGDFCSSSDPNCCNGCQAAVCPQDQVSTCPASGQPYCSSGNSSPSPSPGAGDYISNLKNLASQFEALELKSAEIKIKLLALADPDNKPYDAPANWDDLVNKYKPFHQILAQKFPPSLELLKNFAATVGLIIGVEGTNSIAGNIEAVVRVSEKKEASGDYLGKLAAVFQKGIGIDKIKEEIANTTDSAKLKDLNKKLDAANKAFMQLWVSFLKNLGDTGEFYSVLSNFGGKFVCDAGGLCARINAVKHQLFTDFAAPPQQVQDLKNIAARLIKIREDTAALAKLQGIGKKAFNQDLDNIFNALTLNLFKDYVKNQPYLDALATLNDLDKILGRVYQALRALISQLDGYLYYADLHPAYQITSQSGGRYNYHFDAKTGHPAWCRWELQTAPQHGIQSDKCSFDAPLDGDAQISGWVAGVGSLNLGNLSFAAGDQDAGGNPSGLQDTDGDGVIDSLDQCPDTPSGVTVGSDGCPTGANICTNEGDICTAADGSSGICQKGISGSLYCASQNASACKLLGQSCQSSTDCCSGLLCGSDNTCQNPPACTNEGQRCGDTVFVCQNGTCKLKSCSGPSDCPGGLNCNQDTGVCGISGTDDHSTGGGLYECEDVCKDTPQGTVCMPNPLCQNDIIKLINYIARWLMYFSIPITLIIVIISGYMYMTAGGNPDKVKKASRTLIYALIGLSLILLSSGIIVAIRQFLGGSPKS